jgi:predicted TPR repeat methyltransferase
MFLQHDVDVVNELESLIETQAPHTNFQHIYEIGCGGGQVLAYMRDRFPDIISLTGIDLGAEQIQKNSASNKTNSVEFAAADATSWIPKNAERNCVLMANGGVFEYFLQAELEGLFSFAAQNLSPVAICIIETIGTDHDLETETDSLIYGREMAFSHNYPHLLRKAGFSIINIKERDGHEIDGGGRWIRVLAVSE